jgi:hypothetical protein
VCTVQLGRDKIMSNNCLDKIINLINDPVASIRELSYITMLNFSENGGDEFLL